MKEPNFLEKITNRVWLSFLIWVGLLFTRSYIIKGDIFGTIAELGGFLLFAAALYKWAKRKKKKNNLTKKLLN